MNLAPFFAYDPKTGILCCQIARVDMREILTMAAGERAANYDGLQVRLGAGGLDPFFALVVRVYWWSFSFLLS